MYEGLREDSPLCANDQRRLSMVLKKMCHEHKLLPSSCTITDELEWSGEYPVYRGGYADVWRGAYRGSGVAIKVLRVNARMDLVNLERVQPPVYLLFDATRRVLIRAG